MKLRFPLGVAWALSALSAAGFAHGAEFGAPSLLPAHGYGQYASDAYAVQPAAEMRRGQEEVAAPEPVHDEPMVVQPAPVITGEDYHGPIHAPWDEGCDTCGPGPAYGFGDCRQPCGQWFGGVNGLIFTRSDNEFEQLSFDDTNLLGQELSTNSADMDWAGGVEARIGRMFGNGCGVEVVYWGVYPGTSEDNAYAADIPGNLNTAIDFSALNIGADNVNDLYDASQRHRLRRDFDIHNVEVNVLSGQLPFCGGHGFCPDLQVTWLAGFRYFHLGEGFQFASADADAEFGADPANEVYYDIDADNNLWGAQLGARADYRMLDRVTFHLAPKFGIYGNDIDHSQRIYNDNGVATVGPGNPLDGEAYVIDGDGGAVSFLGEIDLGLDYAVSRNFNATIGYRALALTNVATATEQIPRAMADLPGAADVDVQSSVIVHGAYAGAEFKY